MRIRASGYAESYTPHQLNLKPPATGAFLLRRHPMDSNLGRGAGVRKTRSVFSPRARAPAGGRSRCGSAERIRGILYAAPIELEASGDGGFSFTSASHGFEPRSRRERFNRCFVKFFKLLLDPSRGHVHNNPCVAALPQLDRGSDYESERHRFESYTPHQLIVKAPGDGSFSYIAIWLSGKLRMSADPNWPKLLQMSKKPI